VTAVLDQAVGFVAIALIALAAALTTALLALVAWRAIDELRFLRRQKIIVRYQPLVDALLTATPDPGAITRLLDTPDRHRGVISELMLAALRLTTGDVVHRLRDASWRLGMIDRWVTSLDDRRWWMRAAAIRALGLVREPTVFDRLLRALDETHEEVRAAAVDALGRLGDPRAGPALLARLPDESRHQRARVVEALRALGPSIVPVLIEHARTHAADTTMTLDILGVVGGSAATGSLLEWSGSEEPAVRAAALRAIGTIGLDDRGFFFALRGLGDGDPGVRSMAARALGRSGNQAAVPYLAAHLDAEWLLAAHCATGLRKLGPPGATALEARAASTGQGADLARQMLWELTFLRARV
jgi:HEAT repeat protein